MCANHGDTGNVAALRLSAPPAKGIKFRGQGFESMWRWATVALSIALVLLVFLTRSTLLPYLPEWLSSRLEVHQLARSPSDNLADQRHNPLTTTVIAVAAKPGSLPIQRRTIGIVVPVQSTAVSSPVSGNISEIVAKDGKHVKTGELLARLDDRAILAAIERDKAMLAKDQATLDDARGTFARANTLTKEGADSKQVADDALAAVKVAQASVEVDRANLAADTVLLSQTEIRAPFDGTLGAFQVSTGAFVAPGVAIVTLAQMKPVYAELTLPETDLALARSAHAAGKLDVEVSPMLVSGNSGVAAGAITFIDNAVDGTSATFKLRALLANSNEKLWPGQSLNVLVDAGTVDKLVLVPLVAVQSRDSGAICYVVRPDRTIEVRRVDVALRVGDEAGIVHGLDAGELVVTEGQSSLEEGSHVVLEKTKPKSPVPLQTGEQNGQ